MQSCASSYKLSKGNVKECPKNLKIKNKFITPKNVDHYQSHPNAFGCVSMTLKCTDDKVVSVLF